MLKVFVLLFLKSNIDNILKLKGGDFMYEEFKIDENLLYLYTLLENLECICFDDDILYAIITLKTKVNKKLYSQFDKSSIDFNDYYLAYHCKLEKN